MTITKQTHLSYPRNTWANSPKNTSHQPHLFGSPFIGLFALWAPWTGWNSYSKHYNTHFEPNSTAYIAAQFVCFSFIFAMARCHNVSMLVLLPCIETKAHLRRTASAIFSSTKVLPQTWRCRCIVDANFLIVNILDSSGELLNCSIWHHKWHHIIMKHTGTNALMITDVSGKCSRQFRKQFQKNPKTQDSQPMSTGSFCLIFVSPSLGTH